MAFDGLDFAGPAQYARQGGNVEVRFQFEIAKLAAAATPEILAEMVRKEAVRILMSDSTLQAKIHELALANLLRLAEKT